MLSQPTETIVDVFTPEERNIKSLWTALQVAEKQHEKRGLQFGEACYNLRECSEVVPGGTTFKVTLEKLGIAQRTAYRWIARYEETIGKRQTVEPTPLLDEESDDFENESDEPFGTRTPQERDRNQLSHLTMRLGSISKALRQVLDEKDKWFQYEEISEIRALARNLVTLLTRLNDE